jgi:hypothetical protein
VKINYTHPRRLHIIRNERGWYLTLIIFGRRYHFCSGPDELPEGGLWR